MAIGGGGRGYRTQAETKAQRQAESVSAFLQSVSCRWQITITGGKEYGGLKRHKK